MHYPTPLRVLIIGILLALFLHSCDIARPCTTDTDCQMMHGGNGNLS